MEETKTKGLAAAIREIQEAAKRSISPASVQVPCSDGKAGTFTLPITILQDGAGGLHVDSLVDEIRAGHELARELRLLSAPGPDRREGVARHQSLDSFIEHANRFKSKDSAVWANAVERTLVSVLDYHPAGAESPARWGKHRGVYPCPLSEAWLAWGGGKPLALDQDAFAALLDSRDRELAVGKLPSGLNAPDPAALITLASNLEVFSTATAKRERDPNTGRVKISFSEEKGMNGTVMPPPSFLILIPVFQDSEPQLLEVRLRVDVEEGAAKFKVQVHAAGDVLRQAFGAVCNVVAVETELALFVGTPE